MKVITKIFVALLLTLAVSVPTFANSPKELTNGKIDWQKAEQNYIRALGSENIGLRQSAANFLAQYRLSGAVKNLITTLKTDKVEQIRMAAALALIQIGDTEGRNAVQDASVYDGSESVAKFCKQLLEVSTTVQDISAN